MGKRLNEWKKRKNTTKENCKRWIKVIRIEKEKLKVLKVWVLSKCLMKQRKVFCEDLSCKQIEWIL